MSNLLFGHDQAVAEWVARQAGQKPFSAPFNAFGIVDDNGRLTGGFVFTGFNGHNIELSLAGRTVATRGAMAAVLSYVFAQLGCSRMQMHTRCKGAKRVRRQIAKLGMKYEGVARRFYGREDAACYALTIDDLADFKSRWRLT
jgi:RimJ/RimL family protein N-acetyltransferase